VKVTWSPLADEQVDDAAAYIAAIRHGSREFDADEIAP